MPRPKKEARLYLRKRKDRDPVYVIRDEGGFERSTGTGCLEEAEANLAAHIEQKYRRSGPAQASEITIGKILTIYAEEYALTEVADPARIGYAIDALDEFWGDLTAAECKGATCRRYAASRYRVDRNGEKHPISDGTIRRELGVLQAAFNYCAREGYLIGAPLVTRPPEPAGKEAWLSRVEVAALIRAARGLRLDGSRQLVRWILASFYTGTRKKAALALAIDLPSPVHGWIDSTSGILYRGGYEERETKKRKGIARVPRKFLNHVRRWKRMGARYVCEDYQGNRVGDIKSGFRAARIAAGLGPEVTPHVMKHTAITHAIQNGATLSDAASFFNTTIETIQKVYWHHSPYAQQTAVDALDSGGFRGVSGAKLGGGRKDDA